MREALDIIQTFQTDLGSTPIADNQSYQASQGLNCSASNDTFDNIEIKSKMKTPKQTTGQLEQTGLSSAQVCLEDPTGFSEEFMILQGNSSNSE